MNCDYCGKEIGEYIEGDVYCSICCLGHAEEEEKLCEIGSPPVAKIDSPPDPKTETPWPKSPWNADPFAPHNIYDAAPDPKKETPWSKAPWNARPFAPQKIHDARVAEAHTAVLETHAETFAKLSGVKYDSGKTPLELLPLDAVEEVAKVLQFGAKKYAPNNWRGGFVYGRVFGALLRHLFSWWRGEDKDPETGLSPLAHAACDVLFLLHFVLAKTGTDNRKENNL